jgi:hypothetical protein
MFASRGFARAIGQRCRVAAATAARRRPLSTSSSSSSTGGGSADAGAAAGDASFFKSDKWTKLVGTVGAFANWGIPLAAITHVMSDKDPATTIDPRMAGMLAFYSSLFVRWSLAISPANYPLTICHGSNVIIQLVQLGRHMAAPAPAAVDDSTNDDDAKQ